MLLLIVFTLALFAGLAALATRAIPAPGAAPGVKRVHVRMDTSAWTHRRGWLVFRFTTKTPDCPAVHTGPQPYIRFADIAHDASTGPLSTSGCSGMAGTLIMDPREPATWSVPRTGEQEFAINFADREFRLDEAWIGSFLRFTVELPTIDLDPKEEFSVALLDRDWKPALRTAAPSGFDALVRFKADPSHRTWRPEVFAPARQATADTIDVVFPRPPRSAGPAIKPRRVPPRIHAYRDLDGKMWIEYAVPSPGGAIRVRVFDRKGVERFRHDSLVTVPGVYGVEWPESRKDPPRPPGHYRIVVDIAGHRLETKCDL